MQLYYDCPIKALYMMKEFGVKFRHPSGGNIVCIAFFVYECDRIAQGLKPTLSRHLLHQDSCGIMMPCVGDIVDKDIPNLVIADEWRPGLRERRHYLATADVKKGEYGIIMRRGKEFFWPEREECPK